MDYVDFNGTISVKNFFGLINLGVAGYKNFLCVRLYMWGFTHRKSNATYDFSSWKKLILKRIKESNAIKTSLKRLLLSTCTPVNYIKSKQIIDFYKYKKNISDWDLILSIGGGGSFQVTIEKTKKIKNGRYVYNVNLNLINEKFNFEQWQYNVSGKEFGAGEKAHSKNLFVTLINNIGFYTQKFHLFVDFTWKFSVNYEITLGDLK